MPRRRGNVKRGKRSSRRGHTRRTMPPTSRIPALPPPLAINSNRTTLWLRNYVTVNSGLSFIDNVGSDVFFYDTNYSTIFGEYRIKRINVWYVPSASFTKEFVYSFSVVDAGESTATSSFKNNLLMPGSSIRKAYQYARAVWYPTEPSDRDWREFNNSWTIMTIRIATTGTNTIGGYVMYDAHVEFRSTKAQTTQLTRVRDSPATRTPASSTSGSLEDRMSKLEGLLERLNILEL